MARRRKSIKRSMAAKKAWLTRRERYGELGRKRVKYRKRKRKTRLIFTKI